MKLDPRKSKVAKLLPLLKRLGAAAAKGRPEPERDWTAETAKTLAAGKLENFDLTEFAVAAFAAQFDGPADAPLNRPYAEALIALIDQMASNGIRDDRVGRIRESLKRRTEAPS